MRTISTKFIAKYYENCISDAFSGWFARRSCHVDTSNYIGGMIWLLFLMFPEASVLLLLVDDDDLVRGTIADGIREEGWDVIEAATAEEALTLPAVEERLSVLVTDINLGPGLDGVAFAPLARQLWPNIGVVYISGRPLDPIHVRPEQRELFLLKPFDQSTLTEAISDVLDQRDLETNSQSATNDIR